MLFVTKVNVLFRTCVRMNYAMMSVFRILVLVADTPGLVTFSGKVEKLYLCHSVVLRFNGPHIGIELIIFYLMMQGVKSCFSV